MLRILVVDDNADHRFLERRVLKGIAADVPLAVEFAEDGEDALLKLQAIVPDLLLLDIKMPRKDGFDVLEAVRRDPRTAALPVVMFTSSEAGADVDRARALGASDYLTKPLDAKAFAEDLRACVVKWARRLGRA
jgi:CheY-like chemotaxis protein